MLAVGLGGAVGAMARYWISSIPLRTNLSIGTAPILTLVVNLLGALLIGFIVGTLGKQPGVSPYWIAFLKTGVCGGFTTFSTFSLETLSLLENGKVLPGILYAGLSVCLCILGVLAGKTVGALLQNGKL